MKIVAVMMLMLAYASSTSNASNCSCSKCYGSLVKHVVQNDENVFRLLQTFFPPNDHPPVFVTVQYEFENSSTYYTYFWTLQSSYFIQPLKVFQFTSLFLGTPAYLSGELIITLPDECENANPEHLEMLTYLVSYKEPLL